MTPKIALIILNWKQLELTFNTLDSIFKCHHHGFDYHIYLIDNGSPDNSLSQFKEKYSQNKQVTILETGNNSVSYTHLRRRRCAYSVLLAR